MYWKYACYVVCTNSFQDTAQDIELYLRSNYEQKVKEMTRDVRGKPLINLDRRHKTSGADNRSCLVLLIASNFRIQCSILTRSLSVTMLCVKLEVAREQV